MCFIFITGPLTATYVLTVAVTDVNDFTPYCTKTHFSASIAEDSPTSTTVAQITCADDDQSSPNKDISGFTIINGNTGKQYMLEKEFFGSTECTQDMKISISVFMSLFMRSNQ